MRITLLSLWLSALMFPANAASPSREIPSGSAKETLSDYETVRRAEGFSIGGVGIAATIAPPETSLRKILQSPNAAENCRKLISKGTLAGQLYGLLGLKLLKDATYPKVAARYKLSRTEVAVCEGCIVSKKPIFFIAQQIDQGKLK